MEKHKLQPLTATEKIKAEENHNLVYGFLHRYGYSCNLRRSAVVDAFFNGRPAVVNGC